MKLAPLLHGALHNCFGCGVENKSGLRLKFFVDEEQQIVCRLRVPRRFEGPPGHVHGGVIATLLDEAMSKANRQFGIVAMTRTIEVEYLKPVPLKVALMLTAQHKSSEGRKHHCESQITDPSGIRLAIGKALFLEVKTKT